MSTPANTKTVRVSNETHKAINDLAAELGGSVDDALRHLMGESTVRVPVSTVQRDRWTLAAQTAGVDLPHFVAMSVERGMTVDRATSVECAMQAADRKTITQIWHIVKGLGIAAGTIPPDPPAPR